MMALSNIRFSNLGLDLFSSIQKSTRFFDSIPGSSLKEKAIYSLIINLNCSLEDLEGHIKKSKNTGMGQIFDSMMGRLRLKFRLTTFLKYVSYGEINEAEKFLNANIHILPILLKSKSIIVTKAKGINNHVIVEGTALRIALASCAIHDINDFTCRRLRQHHFLPTNTESMVGMIKRYMKMLPDGELEIAKQTHEQFPNGWEQIEAERIKPIYSVIEMTINTINNNSYDDYEEALQKLRNALEPPTMPDGIIRTGRYFSGELIVYTCHLLKDYLTMDNASASDTSQAIIIIGKQLMHFFNRYEYERNQWKMQDIICVNIIGYLERFVPAANAIFVSPGLNQAIEDSVFYSYDQLGYEEFYDKLTIEYDKNHDIHCNSPENGVRRCIVTMLDKFKEFFELEDKKLRDIIKNNTQILDDHRSHERESCLIM